MTVMARNPRTLLSFYLAKDGWVANIRHGDVIERHVVAKSANDAEMDRAREAQARADAERLIAQNDPAWEKETRHVRGL